MTRPEKMSDAQIMHARSTAWEKWDGEGDQRLWYARVIEAARDAQWAAALAASGKPATPYAWAVTGMGRPFFGAFAEADARAEAKRCGGDTRAFPLYTSPANESPGAHAPGVCIDINGSPMLVPKGSERLGHRKPLYTSPAVPHGWVAVPVEPTREMLCVWIKAPVVSNATARGLYADMISAAPKVTQ